MGWIENSIRNRLFLSLCSFIFIILIQLSVSFYAIKEIEEIAELRDSIAEVNNDWLNIYNNLFKYISVETHNTQYFKSEQSAFIDYINEEKIRIRSTLNQIAENPMIQKVEMRGMIDSMIRFFSSYESLMVNLESKILEKGFKDYGVEGEMRFHIHQLEESNLIPLEEVLAIRRNEKDYLLRGDESYADKLRSIAKKQVEILHKIGTPEAQKEAQLLTKYIRLFDYYVVLNNELGLFNDTGLKREIELKGDFLVQRFDKFKRSFADRVEYQLTILKITLVITAIGILTMSVFLSIFFSRSLTRPILNLSKRMKEMDVERNAGKRQVSKSFKGVPTEVRSLTEAYNRMSTQINSQLFEIRAKNMELENQNTALEKLNKELDRFIYHTSHDLRSPLTSVLGLVEVMEISPPSESKQYLEYVKMCVHQLDSTIVDIIHYYKNRSLEIKNTAISVRQLVQDIYNQNRFHPKAGGVTFINSVAENQLITCDEYRLKIILKNLLSNAIKYHDPKKVNPFMKVSVGETEECWILKFEDNGIGISEAHKSKIFEMFYRASDKSNGSGLGLFIVLDSVKKMNGNIKVNTGLGVGTTFIIELPKLIH